MTSGDSNMNLANVFRSTDRHKLFLLNCREESFNECLGFLANQHIEAVNIGLEVSVFLNRLEDYRYLNLEVSDFIIKMLNERKHKPEGSMNDVVVIYNLGILMEHALEINASQLLKNFAKNVALIIIGDALELEGNKLFWPNQKESFSIDFNDTSIKQISYEI
jgi:hypothetical protein